MAEESSTLKSKALSEKPTSNHGILGWICKVIPWKPEVEELPPGHTIELKAELIAQEHRLFHLIRNAMAYGRLPASDPRHQAAFNAGFWRLLTSSEVQASIAVGGTGLIAIIGLVLTLQSIRIAEQQKDQALIQNALAEAQRMAELHSEVTALTREISESENPAATNVFDRVHGLCRVLEPYRSLKWDGDMPRLSERLTSRERGELLIACARADMVDPLTFASSSGLYYKIDFSYSDLAGQQVLGNNLGFCRLSFCEASDGIWMGVLCEYADLESANFQATFMKFVDFHNALLSNANFADADLTGVNFSGATLPNAHSFKGASLHGVHLDGAHVNEKDWIQKLRNVATVDEEWNKWEMVPDSNSIEEKPSWSTTSYPKRKSMIEKLGGWRIQKREGAAVVETDKVRAHMYEQFRIEMLERGIGGDPERRFIRNPMSPRALLNEFSPASGFSDQETEKKILDPLEKDKKENGGSNTE